MSDEKKDYPIEKIKTKIINFYNLSDETINLETLFPTPKANSKIFGDCSQDVLRNFPQRTPYTGIRDKMTIAFNTSGEVAVIGLYEHDYQQRAFQEVVKQLRNYFTLDPYLKFDLKMNLNKKDLIKL